MQSAARSYFQTQVSTTTQGDLVIMLFDAALKFLHQAKEKIAAKDVAQKGILISKAMDILSELQGSLNAQKGGELADRLQKLYFYCNARLLYANLKQDIGAIEGVERILNGLREAFAEANAQVATKVVPTSMVQTSAPQVTQPAAPAAVNLPRAQAYQHGGASSATRIAPAANPVAASAPQPAPEDTVADDSQPATRTLRPVPSSNHMPNSPRPTVLPGSGTASKPTPVQRVMAAYAASRQAS